MSKRDIEPENPFFDADKAELASDAKRAKKMSKDELDWIRDHYYLRAKADALKADPIHLVYGAVKTLLIEVYRSRRKKGKRASVNSSDGI